MLSYDSYEYNLIDHRGRGPMKEICSIEDANLYRKVARRLKIYFRTLKKAGQKYIPLSDISSIVEPGKVYIQIGATACNLREFWSEVKKERNK